MDLKRVLWMAMALVLTIPVASLIALAAEEDEKKKEEDRVFDDEEARDKAALDNESGPTLHRNLTGMCTLDVREFTDEEKARMERVNAGTFKAEGKQYILRVSSMDVWKTIYQESKAGKPLSLQGKLRINGTVFVATSAMAVAQGSSAPPSRRKRGGF